MMCRTKRVGVFIGCLLIMAAFSGCAAPGSNISAGDTQPEGGIPWPGGVYQPKLSSNIVTLDAAKKELAALLQSQYLDDNAGIRYHGRLGLNKPADQNNLAEYAMRVQAYMLIRDAGGEFKYLLPKDAVTVLEDRIAVGPVFAFFYADLPESLITVEKSRDQDIRTSWLGTDRKIYNDTDPALAKYAIGYRPKYMRPYMIQCGGLISFFFKSRAGAERFADALFFIQQTLKKQQDERRALFESQAAQYRALTIKPPVAEEQRKQIVLANVLTQRKDYAGAIDLYLKAVELDPVSYPGAYFNLALLSAQLERYNKAIAYMRQYLLLAPEAPDARSARDKIYEWEFLMQK
ncbi:MAG: tetratricopeptide repeat protein [Thermodesulfobacteriota bacterium]